MSSVPLGTPDELAPSKVIGLLIPFSPGRHGTNASRSVSLPRFSAKGMVAARHLDESVPAGVHENAKDNRRRVRRRALSEKQQRFGTNGQRREPNHAGKPNPVMRADESNGALQK